MEAFRSLAVRSEPLVSAIHRYERANGRPPALLKDLVPRYLSEIPTTGMGAYPRYEYLVGPMARRGYDGNDWILYVDAPSGFMNWNQFFYYPNQRYPNRASWLRLGKWAYLHE